MTAVVVPLLVDEFADWMPWAARRLITRAARRLPARSRERYQAEWLAELAALPGGKLNQTRFGFTILIGSFTLRKTLNEASSHELMQPVNLGPLSPDDFERLVGQLLSAMGYKSQVVGGPGDGGVDILARDPRPVSGRRVVVQVKKYQGMVGIEQVRTLLWAAREHKADKAIFVTSSQFGSASRKLAARYGYLELIDGATLRKLMAEYLNLDLRTDPRDKSQ
ncbi:restriction endonuclease [Microtetraspora malaysiensis]|uniref:restriction endonuclease n=1 Tax=Microtetraspora malaysiensis TaxID=161358 RepID=UPI003D8AA4D6